MSRLTVVCLLALTLLVACGDDDGADAGGMAVCSLTGANPAPACAPAAVTLSTEICRCGSHYYWDGAACVATAACTCSAGCDLLYETEAACMAAYSACASDGGT